MKVKNKMLAWACGDHRPPGRPDQVFARPGKHSGSWKNPEMGGDSLVSVPVLVSAVTAQRSPREEHGLGLGAETDPE